MYFLSLDTFHLILALAFAVTSLALVSLRVRRYTKVREDMMNYVRHTMLLKARIIALSLAVMTLSLVVLKPTGLIGDSISPSPGIDCVWLLDTSLSMDVIDAGNISAPTSRLTQAKSIIEGYMIAHPDNRYGLVIFAGKARLVSPLTTEHSSLLSFLSSIDSKSITEGGTDFKEALSVALERFSGERDTPHAIILLSDGGDSEDAPDVDTLKSLFSDRQATLVTVGVGQTKPSPIPTGTSPFGEALYKRFQGETVLSGLHKDTLKNLANLGRGTYIDGNNRADSLAQALQTVATHNITDTQETARDMTVWALVIASFLCFLVFLLLPSSSIGKGNAS